jgi:hypothetical protein
VGDHEICRFPKGCKGYVSDRLPGHAPRGDRFWGRRSVGRRAQSFFGALAPVAEEGPVDNPDHVEERYRDWLAAERDALKAAAPYYAPRLTAIALHTSQLDKDKEMRGDPRVALLEMILQMRDRDEIGLQALPASKSNGNGRGEIIEAVVAKVVEEDEDNGDGEAA